VPHRGFKSLPFRKTMNDSNYYFNDKEKGTAFFVSQLSQGHKWARYVAKRLNDLDIACHVDDMEVAETVKERQKFHNEKDVIFTSMSGCLEVKSQSCEFTDDPSSWPYRRSIVDTALGWSRKTPKPLATVLVCIHNGSMLVIPSSTQDQWRIEEKYDRYRQITDNFLTIDARLLRPFDELADWLRVRQSKASA
jgi:hypothetical protein